MIFRLRAKGVKTIPGWIIIIKLMRGNSIHHYAAVKKDSAVIVRMFT